MGHIRQMGHRIRRAFGRDEASSDDASDPEALIHPVERGSMMERSLPAFSVDDLAEATGVEDLEMRLWGAGIRPVRVGEERLVLSGDWYRYVGEVILEVGADRPILELPPGDEDDWHAYLHKADRAGDDAPHEGIRDGPRARPIIRAEQWDAYRREMFRRYPWLAELLERFVTYLREQRPATVINQTGSTVTLIHPNGGWVGMYPKPTQGGLQLRAIRRGKRHVEFIKADEDFDRVVEWLDELPGYGDSPALEDEILEDEMVAQPLSSGIVTRHRDTWDNAVGLAESKKRLGADWHRTNRRNVWWVDPEPNPATSDPARYWVTLHDDGCFSCVCSTWARGNPCIHIARVYIETGVPPMIWSDNPACASQHNKRIKGYTKEDLALDNE